MKAQYAAIVFSAAVLLFVVDLVRREKLTFRYAAGWMAASAVALLIAVFDEWLERIAHAFGFQLASNFIFFLVLGGLVLMTLLMTLFLCRQNKRNDRLAQKIGMLELEIEKLKRK
jgi:hypothetical protein